MNQFNFYPQQYAETGIPPINHNYLPQQFSDYRTIFDKIEMLIQQGDYTLGAAVDSFENRFAQIANTKFAIGVGSGTDALFLSLKAIGVKAGDEVITTPYTFFATIGAIVTAGAKPVFIDIADDFNIDPSKIEAAITPQTKAILPVHWSGLPCNMDKITEIAKRHQLDVIEDACHAIKATYKQQSAGSWGTTGCFSLHPLKNLNVWGDGGIITTNNEAIYKKLCLMRNHGLINRDECALFGYNSRLDTLQAIVGNHLLDKMDVITDSRISHAKYFDQELANIDGITVPHRNPEKQHVFHLYIIKAKRRNDLQAFLTKQGIDAKVHYPIPMHLQPAAKTFGYQVGDFPVCETLVGDILSLPVHEFITKEQQDFVVNQIKAFYR